MSDYETQLSELKNTALMYAEKAKDEADPEEQKRLFGEALQWNDVYDRVNEEYQLLEQNQLSPVEKLRVGTGKALSRMGDATKQTYLMLKDEQTGGDEAQRFTQKLNEEEEMWHRQFPDVGWQTAGQAIPTAAMAFMLPEASGALRGGAMGALEETMFSPTPEATWKAKAQAAGGGSAVGVGLGSMFGARVNPEDMTEQSRRALMSDPSRKFSPTELAPRSEVLRKLDKFAMGSRKRVREGIESGRQNLEDLTNQFRQGDSNAFVMMQDQINKFKTAEDDLYSEVYSRIGDAPVDMPAIQNTVANRLQAKMAEGAENPAEIQKAWEMVADPQLLPEPPYTIEKMRLFRSKLREKNQSWWKNRDDGGVSPENMSIIYDTLSDEISEAARLTGDLEAAKWLDTANKTTAYRYQKQAFVDDVMSQKKMASRLKSMGTEEVDEFLRPMNPQQRQQVVSDIFEAAERKGRGGTATGDFNPLTTANELVAYRDNLSRIMSPEQLQELDGTIDYLRTTGAALSETGDPSRGFGLLALSGAGQAAVGGALAYGAAGGAVGAGVGYLLLPQIMRNRTFRGLARQLNAAEGSRAKKYIATKMNGIVEREARTLLNQIDVQNKEDWKQEAVDRAYSAYGKTTKELLDMEENVREKGSEAAEKVNTAVESGLQSAVDTGAAIMAEPPPDYLTREEALQQTQLESPVEQQQSGAKDRVKMKNTHRLHTYNDWVNTWAIRKRREELRREK